jgi:hypothetical protein
VDFHFGGFMTSLLPLMIRVTTQKRPILIRGIEGVTKKV